MTVFLDSPRLARHSIPIQSAFTKKRDQHAQQATQATFSSKPPGRTSAICLTPLKARELIRAGVKWSLGKIGKIKPYKITISAKIKLECATTDVADGFERGGSERLDAFTVRRIAMSALDILKI